ncbi:MAG TPA: DoxX family protein [Ignavibacteriaceae bacterium]|nr:DoxX family protein [Ignavibacteriaceae bacterium]
MNFKEIFSKYSDQIYAIMRIAVGILFFSHGYQKAIRIVDGTFPTSNILMMGAAIIEFFGGLMIIFGWKTFWAAFICSGQMAVAYFKSHQPKDIWPIDNGGEKAAFYAFVFLFIAVYGAGIWSIDNLFDRKKNISRFNTTN